MAMRGAMLAVVAVVSALVLLQAAEAQTLTVGYYSQRCPKAETIVYEEVRKAYSTDKGIAAGLLRLHFHDCFVNGCDASVLLDSSTSQAEKNAPPNQSLRGYGVIDTIKARLEATCKQTVSCADILAYAARDSVRLASGSYNYTYKVPGGRPDGTVSSLQMAKDNLPAHNQRNVTLLHEKYFKPKTLSMDDLIVLSGAHTLGVAHCGTFDYRLNTETDKGMDATFRNQLRSKCNHTTTNKVALDDKTPTGFDTKYYDNVLANRTVLESDAALNSPTTVNRVRQLRDLNTFLGSFATSMGNMGKLRTSNPGKVRDNCRRVRW